MPTRGSGRVHNCVDQMIRRCILESEVRAILLHFHSLECGGHFLEITPWGEMHEELKNEKMNPISDVDEYIIQLNNELKGNIVKQKEKIS